MSAAPQPFRATVLTLFPDVFPGTLAASVIGKARAAGIWALDVRDIRDFAADRHRTVDDVPFGGGAGMVLRCDVVDRALASVAMASVSGAVDAVRPTLYLTPRGAPLDQARVRALATGPGVILLCGRYEGVDQRVIEAADLEEVSVGDFVLAGGEVAALALIEAVVRLLPGVLGAEASLGEESLEHGLLEYPHYTRPAEWTDRAGRQRPVPSVLVSGHHAEITAWRRREAETTTRRRRPDLWRRYLRAQQKTAKGS